MNTIIINFFILFFLCGLVACHEDANLGMELVRKQDGSLSFNRSKPLKDTVRIIVYSEDEDQEMLWNVTWGGRPFTNIEYGVLPDFADQKIGPNQIRPEKTEPRIPDDGEAIFIVLSYVDDALFGAGRSHEVWECKAPEPEESAAMTLRKDQ